MNSTSYQQQQQQHRKRPGDLTSDERDALLALAYAASAHKKQRTSVPPSSALYGSNDRRSSGNVGESVSNAASRQSMARMPAASLPHCHHSLRPVQLDHGSRLASLRDMQLVRLQQQQQQLQRLQQLQQQQSFSLPSQADWLSLAFRHMCASAEYIRSLEAKQRVPAPPIHHVSTSHKSNTTATSNLVATATSSSTRAKSSSNDKSKVTLHSPRDRTVLSPHQILLRQQIQVVTATETDTTTHMRGRNKPLQLGQVGIQCRHCAHMPVSLRLRGSTYFPATLNGLYQAAQNMSIHHLQCGACPAMPLHLHHEFTRLSLPAKNQYYSMAGRSYWAQSARDTLGLVDGDNGIRMAALEEVAVDVEATAIVQT